MPHRLVKKANGRLLTGALIGAMLAFFAAIGYAWYDSQKRIGKNDTARLALCAQRVDLDSRIVIEMRRLSRDRQYLKENPHGAPGIPEALIRAAINDDADTLASSRKTRENLSILDC